MSYYTNTNTGAYGSAGGFQSSSSGNYYGAPAAAAGGAGGDDKNKQQAYASNPYAASPFANPSPNPMTQSQGFSAQPQQQASSAVPSSSQAQPQQPSIPNMPNIFTPGVASTFAGLASNNPDAMMNIGRTFLDQGTAKMIPGLERTMTSLRVYFAVDNKYVQKKMLRVLFSFFFKHWTREEVPVHQQHYDPKQGGKDAASVYPYAPPTHDENALDLYIPSMSLVTYVLLSAVCYGTTGQFNAEVMSDVMTKCCVVQLIEVLAFRMGYYVLQVSIPVYYMDLFAVTGYKFLGLTINMFVGYVLSLALGGSDGSDSSSVGDDGEVSASAASSSSSNSSWGTRGFYGTFLWTASAASYFVLKFMLNNIPDHVIGKNAPKKEVVVLAFAGSQFAIMWFLGQTKALR